MSPLVVVVVDHNHSESVVDNLVGDCLRLRLQFEYEHWPEHKHQIVHIVAWGLVVAVVVRQLMALLQVCLRKKFCQFCFFDDYYN